MEKIIVLLYKTLGKCMSIVAQLPYVVDTDSRIIIWGFTSMIFLAGLAFLFLGTGGPKGVRTPIRGGMGILLSGSIALSGAMSETNYHIAKKLPEYVILAFGIILILMIVVLAENFIVGKGQGIGTLSLWLGELFMATLGLRVWYLNKNNEKLIDYQRLFKVSAIQNKYSQWMHAHSFDKFTNIGQWFVILICLSVGVILMAKVRKVIQAEYGMLSGSMIIGVLVYMLYLSHEGTRWDVFDNAILFMILAIVQLQFLFLLFYIPVKHVIQMDKEKQKAGKVLLGAVVAEVEALVTGILWTVSGLFCVNLAKDGAMSGVVNPIATAMSWFYKKLPNLQYAYKTDFLYSEQRVWIGMAVATLFSLAVTILLFLVLKLILGDLAYEGMTLSWLRNSVLVFVIPVVLYWFSTMSASKLGSGANWLHVFFRAISCLGLMMCFSNFIPAIRKKGAMSLVKWTLVGLVVSLLFCGLLIPVLMIFA